MVINILEGKEHDLSFPIRRRLEKTATPSALYNTTRNHKAPTTKGDRKSTRRQKSNGGANERSVLPNIS